MKLILSTHNLTLTKAIEESFHPDDVAAAAAPSQNAAHAQAVSANAASMVATVDELQAAKDLVVSTTAPAHESTVVAIDAARSVDVDVGSGVEVAPMP